MKLPKPSSRPNLAWSTFDYKSLQTCCEINIFKFFQKATAKRFPLCFSLPWLHDPLLERGLQFIAGLMTPVNLPKSLKTLYAINMFMFFLYICHKHVKHWKSLDSHRETTKTEHPPELDLIDVWQQIIKNTMWNQHFYVFFAHTFGINTLNIENH